MKKIKKLCFNKIANFLHYLEEQMKMLYPLEEPSKMTSLFIKEQVIKIIFSVIIISTLMFLAIHDIHETVLNKDGSIDRPSYEEEEKEVSLKVQPKDNSFHEESINFSVSPKEFSYNEFKKEIEKGKKYIERTVLNENISSKEISKDLFFPRKVEKSFLQLRWETDKTDIIDETGKIHNLEQKKEEIVTITAIFYYKKFEAAHTFCVSVVPYCFTEEENFYHNIKQRIEEESNRNDDKIYLPKKINGKNISYNEKVVNKKIYVIILFLLIFGIFEVLKRDLDNRLKKREQQLKLDYPEIMNQIALLLSAGMNIRSVFGRIAVQYEDKARKQKKRYYGYEEITVTYYEMENGMPETEALERLGDRVQLISYRKLMTLLIQNARKGSKDLVNLLEIEAYEAYEDRKELVRTLGEEAGTKLLFPMIIMLLIILTIILVPVFMTL